MNFGLPDRGMFLVIARASIHGVHDTYLHLINKKMALTSGSIKGVTQQL